MALAGGRPETSHAAGGAHFVHWLCEQAQERKPAVGIGTGMQRDEADHVVVQQRTCLAHRLIGFDRRGAVQQKVVGDDAELNRPLRCQSRRRVDQPRQRQPDGWMSGRVQRDGTRRSLTGACEVGQPRGGFLIERRNFLFLR